MILNNNRPYKIGVERQYSNIMYRSFSTFKNYLFFLSIAFIILLIKTGLDGKILFVFLFLLLAFYTYSVMINWKLVYRIKYYPSSDAFEVITIKGCKIVQELSIKRSRIEVSVRQNFGFRHTLWQLLIFDKGKLIISQIEISGWDKEKFLKIERDFKVTQVA